jgi:hypothetical protein
MSQIFSQPISEDLRKNTATEGADKDNSGCPTPLPLAQNRMFLMFLLILFLFGFHNE